MRIWRCQSISPPERRDEQEPARRARQIRNAWQGTSGIGSSLWDVLMLRTMHNSDEIRSTDEVDRGAKTSVGASELKLAERLTNDLSKDKFEADKFKVLFSYS